MIITKPIHGVMEIDARPNGRGVIWINSVDGWCIFRTCGLNFEIVDERFSSIDITNSKVVMYPNASNPENEHSNIMSNFLNSIFEVVVGKVMNKSTEEQQKFLVSILDKLRRFTQEEK